MSLPVHVDPLDLVPLLLAAGLEGQATVAISRETAAILLAATQRKSDGPLRGARLALGRAVADSLIAGAMAQ